jgi:hypothetical protein
LWFSFLLISCVFSSRRAGDHFRAESRRQETTRTIVVLLSPDLLRVLEQESRRLLPGIKQEAGDHENHCCSPLS